MIDPIALVISAAALVLSVWSLVHGVVTRWRIAERQARLLGSGLQHGATFRAGDGAQERRRRERWERSDHYVVEDGGQNVLR